MITSIYFSPSTIYLHDISIQFSDFWLFFPIIEKGNEKGHMSFFVFGVVLMQKILNTFNALLQGAAPLSGGIGYVK